MVNRLYVIPLSNPSAAAASMLAHKRLPHRVVTLPAGLHPQLLRWAGFAGPTVPAAELEGRKLQGTLELSSFLEELRPHPPLFPSDPVARDRVKQAERWGETELQPLPRRIFRYCLLHDRALRRWTAGEVMGMPAPGLVGELSKPIMRRMAARSASEPVAVREDLARLPALLDHADALIAEGTIGGTPPNAADFQIFTSVRVLLEVQALAQMAAGRPCAEVALRLYPHWLGPIPHSPALDELAHGRLN